MPPLDRIAGLSVVQKSERASEVLFDDPATLQTVERLPAHVTEGSRFWFYDSQREALSDPGVFVTVSRRAHEYLVEFSNHGWSTSWVAIPREELAQYLWACRDDNREGRRRFYGTGGMRLRPNVNPAIRINETLTSSIREHIRDRIEKTHLLGTYHGTSIPMPAYACALSPTD